MRKKDPRSRRNYVGWMVCRSDPATRRERTFARARSEQDARDMVRRLNERAIAGTDGSPEAALHCPLYWAEWWTKGSSFCRDD